MKTMNVLRTAAAIALSLFTASADAQGARKKPVAAVVSVAVRGIQADPATITDMIRIELSRLEKFTVMDKFEVASILEQNDMQLSNCTGKNCLTEVGRLLSAQKMLSGSVEEVGKNIVFTLHFVDVEKGDVERLYVHEFLNLQDELRNMAKLAILDMFGQPFDHNLMDKLTKPHEFDNAINNPQEPILKLDGPRLGFVTFTGDLYNRMTAPKKEGGYEALPVMFQFGYQFEKQYLNEGNAQALFEFIPMITGLDQGLFIPSASVLHGLRSNVSGWEFALGPTFQVVTFARGYYDEYGKWKLESDWQGDPSQPGQQNPYEIITRVDSRGDITLRSAFVIAVGRTFRSGRLNIPVNAFLVPGKTGCRFGVSFGFNAKGKSTY
jgi:hypothetical protein